VYFAVLLYLKEYQVFLSLKDKQLGFEIVSAVITFINYLNLLAPFFY